MLKFFRVPYNFLFGGVVAVTGKQFEQMHGFSNDFWGWGGEDDDMGQRVGFAGYNITRYPDHVVRYKMIRHRADKKNPRNELVDSICCIIFLVVALN